MKNINILSLTQAYSSLQKEVYVKFLKYYEIDVKDEEVKDFTILVKELSEETDNINIYDFFYVGYKIPQISKEFDLLRLGENCIVNIEIKNKSTVDKMKKQLTRNKYYLNYIGKNVKLFTYVVSEKQLYYLDYNNDVKKDKLVNLVHLLKEQNNHKILKADNLFNPSDYLVSPFNYTKRFINNEYFLTSHQEEIKNEVLSAVKDNTSYKFVSITGSAGTGKTLLVYDIAREIIGIKKRVLIIHCGYLNSGQDTLKSEYNWEIIPIKDYSSIDIQLYDVIIIDEAQRIYSNQLQKIVDIVKSTNGKCIFSYDKVQTLSKVEENRNIDFQINNINNVTSYKLTEKIRTNKEIASFIKALFNSKKNDELANKDNIDINFFNNIDDAKSFIDSLSPKEWEIIRFTPSQYQNEHHEKYFDRSKKSSHRVIGQEFDNVVVVIDKHFFYNTNGELKYKAKTYYHAPKMLFQNITRTKIKLKIVIIDNNEILDRCVSVLSC